MTVVYEKFGFENFDLLIFNSSNPEWERVRSLCLEEDNWLRNNYLPENLIVEDHDIFYIRYEKNTDNPQQFGGIYNNGRYPTEVARTLNRAYNFPCWRQWNNIQNGIERYNDSTDKAMPLLLKFSPVKRKLLFFSMQIRNKGRYTFDFKWFNHMSKIYCRENTGWKFHKDLVQVADCDQPECYQLVIYQESDSYRFSDWNPKTLSVEEYKERFFNPQVYPVDKNQS